MTHLHRCVTAFALLALAASCTKDGSDSTFSLQGHKASQFPSVTDPPKVILEEAGAGDKAPLRYKLVAGSQHPMVMTMYMQMTIAMGGNTLPSVALPGIRMRAQMSVTEVQGGRARVEFVYQGEPEILEGAENPMVAEQLRSSLTGLDGMRGHAVITDRGYTLEGDVQLGPNPDPQLAQMMQSMRQAMDQMAAPLPEEPVGPGARWKVLYHMKMNGIEIYQVGAFELIERAGDDVSLSLEMWQAAPAQAFSPPNMPPGFSARIEQFESSGRGKMKIALARPVPESELEMSNDMRSLIEGGGESQKMSMKMSLRVLLGPQ